MARRLVPSSPRFSQQVLAAVSLCLPACGGIAATDGGESKTSPSDTDGRTPPDDPDVLVVVPNDPDVDPDVPLDPIDPNVTPIVSDPEQPLRACLGETSDLLDNLNPAFQVSYLGLASGSSESILDARYDNCEAEMGGASAVPCGSWSGPLIEPDEYLLEGNRFLIWSQGDSFGSITNFQELLTFLGTIDTAHEARLLLQASPQGALVGGGCVQDGGPYCFVYAMYEPDLSSDPTSCETAPAWYDSYCIAGDGSMASVRTNYTVSGECLGGRRPKGLLPEMRPAGNYFAQLYRLETAAALSFAQLAVELERLGAPSSLVERAQKAAFDECRHSLMAAREARRRGDSWGGCAQVESLVKPSRSILELALENAEEGLVRESFGAAQAELTSQLAPTPHWRRFWGKIARDELSHAELSRDMGAWLQGQLKPDEKILVSERRQKAIEELERELTMVQTHADAQDLGLPTPEQNRALFSHLRGALAA